MHLESMDTSALVDARCSLTPGTASFGWCRKRTPSRMKTIDPQRKVLDCDGLTRFFSQGHVSA